MPVRLAFAFLPPLLHGTREKGKEAEEEEEEEMVGPPGLSGALELTLTGSLLEMGGVLLTDTVTAKHEKAKTFVWITAFAGAEESVSCRFPSVDGKLLSGGGQRGPWWLIIDRFVSGVVNQYNTL
ncbi:hypothetical protein OIU85_005280 [Salix viminalis]|uniref:Uncharacterized protein n=1 Tax=Salix viminalis TaxID=40686 RepID=A0A9Q0STF7_SALVM|nr:hypothetical protein OIU85_005280 [Salix viminalis]